MLETQFILINIHFILNLLAALVCFAVAWLYFDAYLGRKDIREGTKVLGFFLLSFGFIANATQIEISLIEVGSLNTNLILTLSAIFKITGFAVLSLGQLIDPLQPLPSYRANNKDGGFGIQSKSNAMLLFGTLPIQNALSFLTPFLSGITSFLYIRRATLGLEYHLRTIGYSFALLSISELLSLTAAFRGSNNVDLENLTAPYNFLWIVEHFFLILFILILGIWVWGYLVKRLETQLFMIFTSTTLIVFLVTTVSFTSISLSNLKNDILNNLEINANILQFSINGKKAEMLSDAQVVSRNSDLITAVTTKDTPKLNEITTDIMVTKKQSFLVIVADTGEVLSRADDPEKIGGSLSEDPIVKRALKGDETSGVVSMTGVIAPIVSVRAASPIMDASSSAILGAAVVGQTIDNAFLDSLKSATGLDASVYGDSVRSATTFIAPDGKSRWVGILEETADIKKAVLVQGELYKGDVNIMNIPFLSAYAPLKDINEEPVGMVFVGRPQSATMRTASNFIEKTFSVTVILLIISIIPAYFISRYIINQVKS